MGHLVTRCAAVPAAVRLGRRGKQVFHHGGGRRPGVEIPLRKLTTHGPQDLRLLRDLDALRRDEQPEVPAERQQGPQELFGGGIGVDIRHERNVNFDGLQGDLPQAEQRGVASPKSSNHR